MKIYNRIYDRGKEKMTKHTLGPWYAAYSKTDEFSGGNIRSNHHRDGEGALLFQTGPMFHNYTPDREEELANLWLVAVAPELLEALEQYDNFAKANDDWRDGDEPPVDFVVRARQIIAKARGEMDDEPCNDPDCDVCNFEPSGLLQHARILQSRTRRGGE